MKAAGVNPLLHFETYGWHENRDPSLLFSDSKYVAAYPDAAAANPSSNTSNPVRPRTA